MVDRYLIVGDGIAGASAAKRIREMDEEANIQIFTDEDEHLYNRIMLKSYMKGDLPGLRFTRIHDEGWYSKRDIEIYLDTEIKKVDREEGTVLTDKDESYSYDKLLIASGGSPRELPQDEGYENVHYMWTMDDAERIKNSAEDVEKAVVVGGGLLGIDLAVAYAKNDVETDYLIRGSNWWHRGLDETGAEIIHRELRDIGVNVVTGSEVKKLNSDDDKVIEVVDKEGESYEAEDVAVAIGQVPNSEFIDVEKTDRNRIKTDRNLQTSDPDIYAAGNEVEYYSPVFEKRNINGSWDHSEAMGELAGENMVRELDGEDRKPFKFVNTYGVGHFNSQFLAMGDWAGEPVSRSYEEEGHYRRLFFEGDRLVGAVMIGNTDKQEQIRKAIEKKREIQNREEYF